MSSLKLAFFNFFQLFAICYGGAQRHSGLQLSPFVPYFVFFVCCNVVNELYHTLQTYGITGHWFSTEDDHLQRISSHSQHPGRNSKTSVISVDCCRVWQATQTAAREETKAGLQGWITS